VRRLYQRAEGRLAGWPDNGVRALLVVVIAACVFLILQPSRSLRLAAAAWLVLP